MPVAHATVKIYLRTDRPRKDGTCPVYLRVTAHRKKKYLATGVAVEAKHWNERRARVRASHPLAPALNETIARVEAEAATSALGASSASAVVSDVGGSSGSLTAYFERFVSRLEADGKYWERKKFSTLLGKVRGALGHDVAWGEVDRDALRRFERYLRTECENGSNMTRKELSRFRRVFKEAIRDDEIGPSEDPFLAYQMPKPAKVVKRRLALAEVEALRDADLDVSAPTGLARDAFVFAFYVGGMRFSDVCALRADAVRDGRARYRMLKTGTRVSPVVPPPAAEILARQSAQAQAPLAFPLLMSADLDDPIRLRRRINSRNAQLNVSLKRAAAVAEIDPEGLTMHVARHSYADYARRKSGDLHAISQSLGHRDLATTQVYLASLDEDAVDKLGEDLWT